MSRAPRAQRRTGRSGPIRKEATLPERKRNDGTSSGRAAREQRSQSEPPPLDDPIDEASADSMITSDPPPHSGARIGGVRRPDPRKPKPRRNR